MKDHTTKHLNEARQALKRFKHTSSPDDKARIYHNLESVFEALKEEFKGFVQFNADNFVGRERQPNGPDRKDSPPKQGG